MELKLEIVGKEVIKAASSSQYSSLSHDHLQLSIVDCSIPPIYVPVILFFKAEDLTEKSPEIISQKLKTSLSETLSRFYPLAGRIEGVSINCNNEGAVFTEAHTDLLLSDYLKNLDINSLHEFFPKIASVESPGAWPLLSVQASFLGAGSGVALAVCVSHKICDAASLSTFVRAWAATSKGESNDDMSTPHFVGTTIFPPPQETLQGSTFDGFRFKGRCVTNRFVFESSKIAELKLMDASESVPIPTRVEVISALIWKCATKASNSNLIGPRSSCMMQAMDLRLRIPSNILSQDAIGNLQMIFLLTKSHESEFELREIIAEFRKNKEEINEMIKETLESYNTTTFGMNLMARTGQYLSTIDPNMNLYTMTSWCKKPFYEADFGWGRPIWVGSNNHIFDDDQVYVLFMDGKDGESIEAWIGLQEQDMLAFVHDQDLMSYASLNPPILI